MAKKTTKSAEKSPAANADEAAAKKKRIYEVAREFNLSSVAMVEVIRELGYEARNHMAVCTTDMVESIQRKFEEERDASRQEMKRKATQQKEREEREKERVKAKKAAKKVTKRPEPAAEAPKREPQAKPKKRRRPFGAARAVDPVVEVVPDGTEVLLPKEKPKEAPPAKAGERTAPSSTDATDRGAPRKRRRRRGRPAVDQRAVMESVRRTMAQMEAGVTRPRRRRQREDGEIEEEAEDNVLKVNEFSTVGELAALMDVRPAELITKCLQMGMMVTINQRLDMDTIALVADEFGFDVEELAEYAEEVIEEQEEEEDGEPKPRPPVVTIMGHVDHGKTSLLDYVRNTNVVAGEAGGITQHIGAYHVALDKGRRVSFLDTPGHEAFTAMRARGAQVTDVVVLVVAADDNVMPQTIEAIDHARAADVPIVVAINKMDLPSANPDNVKRQLADHNVLVEEFGGHVQSCQISSKTGTGMDSLLELLALETDLLDLKANPDKRAKGAIVEARLDRGRGNVATVLVQSGTLRVGDPFVTGMYSGRVRALLDERSQNIEYAGPSVPVQVLGLDGSPQAGDTFHVVESERQAREISQKRQQLRREQDYHKVRRVSLTDIHEQIQAGRVQELRLIIKGDVDGSVEALCDSLMQITSEEVRLNIIHRGVGGISESDVLLASASDAIIIGFNVRADARARRVASEEQVDIRHYRVIFEAVEDVKAALSGLLKPRIEEQIMGSAEIRETFQVSRLGTVAGCYVSDGLIRRNAHVRVVRDSVLIYEGELGSLRRFKDDVREVQSGFECGLTVEDFNDIKVGDVIEAFELVETTRVL